MKRVTRRTVRAVFEPVRYALDEMKTGFVDSMNGHPVARINLRGRYERLDFCIAGVVGFCSRLFPEYEFTHMEAMKKKLESDDPVSIREIDAVLSSLKELEDKLVRAPFDAVQSAFSTELIAIEFDELRLTGLPDEGRVKNSQEGVIA